MEAKSLPSVEYIRQILDYNPNTGIFIWKYRDELTPSGNRKCAGKNAGTLCKRGYLYISILGKKYLAHRIAWKYITGNDPKEQIDHIDLNKRNNSFSNLREATKSQNQANVSVRSDNRLKIKGISISRGKYLAQISINGKNTNLGRFNNIETAIATYSEAAKKHRGDFAWRQAV